MAKNYAVDAKFHPFYTGGKISDGKDYLYTSCGNQIHCVSEKGIIKHSFGEIDGEEITCFTLSPDNKYILTAERNLLIKQYDLKSNELIKKFKAVHNMPILCMEFDVSSTLLATGSSDGTCKIWDIDKQYYTHNLKAQNGIVTTTKYHPKSEMLQIFTCYQDGMIKRWDLIQSKCIADLKSHTSVVTSLCFSPNENKLYSGGRDNVVIVWDLENNEKLKVIAIFESVEVLFLLPDEMRNEKYGVKDENDYFLTGGSKGQLKVWNAKSACNLYTHDRIVPKTRKRNEDTDILITSGFLSHDKKQLVFVSNDHNILFYDVCTLRLTKQLVGYNDEIISVKFLDNQRILLATNSHLIKIFDVATWSCTILPGHEDIVTCIDVHSNEFFVTGSKDTTVRVWQFKENKIRQIAVGSGHSQAVGAVAFAKLEKYIVSGGSDRILKLWKLEDNKEEETKIMCLGTELAHEKDINSIDISRKDKLVVTASKDKTAKIWSLPDLQLKGTCMGHKRGIWCSQFSPTEPTIITASVDGTLKLWSSKDFSCLNTFEGHSTSVLHATFVNNGQDLLSSASDGNIKLWSIKTRECLKTYSEHDDKIWALATNKDGDRIVSGAADSVLLLWKDVTEEELIAEAEKRSQMYLKQQKLENFLHQGKLLKALRMSINLELPFKCLTILKKIMKSENDVEGLGIILMKLNDYYLDVLLTFASEWNKNSKNCMVAQTLVNCLLKNFSKERLLSLSNIKSFIESFISYSERHYARINTLEQKRTIINYFWECVKSSRADTELKEDEIQEKEIDSSDDDDDEDILGENDNIVKIVKKMSNGVDKRVGPVECVKRSEKAFETCVFQVKYKKRNVRPDESANTTSEVCVSIESPRKSKGKDNIPVTKNDGTPKKLIGKIASPKKSSKNKLLHIDINDGKSNDVNPSETPEKSLSDIKKTPKDKGSPKKRKLDYSENNSITNNELISKKLSDVKETEKSPKSPTKKKQKQNNASKASTSATVNESNTSSKLSVNTQPSRYSLRERPKKTYK